MEDLKPDRLAVAIAQSGKKKADVARESRVTAGTLSRYLKGRLKPDPPVIELLAKATGVPISYLTQDSRGQSDTVGLAVVREPESGYLPDAVALTGLNAEERGTVLRLLDALRSGDQDIRRHLIGQLKIIESAMKARRQQPRAEQTGDSA